MLINWFYLTVDNSAVWSASYNSTRAYLWPDAIVSAGNSHYCLRLPIQTSWWLMQIAKQRQQNFGKATSSKERHVEQLSISYARLRGDNDRGKAAGYHRTAMQSWGGPQKTDSIGVKDGERPVKSRQLDARSPENPSESDARTDQPTNESVVWTDHRPKRDGEIETNPLPFLASVQFVAIVCGIWIETGGSRIDESASMDQLKRHTVADNQTGPSHISSSSSSSCANQANETAEQATVRRSTWRQGAWRMARHVGPRRLHCQPSVGRRSGNFWYTAAARCSPGSR